MRRPAPHAEPAEAAQHVQWRCWMLERGGFDRALARRLAADARTDVHALLELVDRGCPPPLAARILAPLDAGPERGR
jgi:hypothetical protein